MLKNKQFRTLLLIGLFGALLALSACTPATVMPTPTPTRTPHPTATATPTPTPTPAFPVTVGCEPFVPEAACARLRALVEADPMHFTWAQESAYAEVRLGSAELPNAQRVGTWTYAIAAPFYTLDDDTTTADLQARWSGAVSAPLCVTTDTLRTLVTLWGPPADAAVRAVAPDALLAETQAAGGWALLPFDSLSPQWKVLQLDGISLVEKGFTLGLYPLEVPLYLSSAARPETLALLPLTEITFSNRNESEMTILAMTGVTAMTRATGLLMDARGVTYPAQDIEPWFADADFVHISNEVSFRPDCVAEGSGTMSFCSNDSYIGLLEAVHANIIELTGNHLADKGFDWIDHSLDMYRERGWQWFGGGYNLADATRPLTITHNGNRIAFIGCNPIGPSYDWATEDGPGSAPCDYDQMKAEVQQLRADGYVPIVTLQYLETYEYFPTDNQLWDFRDFARAGATIVQGSQAHQAQTFELYGDSFIHYGPGNFFFDQMWSLGTRQEYVTRYTFYEGRLLSIDLRTALLEEYGRPRPMTPDERREFLQMMFDLSPEGQ